MITQKQKQYIRLLCELTLQDLPNDLDNFTKIKASYHIKKLKQILKSQDMSFTLERYL